MSELRAAEDAGDFALAQKLDQEQKEIMSSIRASDDESTSVLIHTKCKGVIEWVYLRDYDASIELLKKLDPNGGNSIAGMSESKTVTLEPCRCEGYDFPDVIDA